MWLCSKVVHLISLCFYSSFVISATTEAMSTMEMTRETKMTTEMPSTEAFTGSSETCIDGICASEATSEAFTGSTMSFFAESGCPEWPYRDKIFKDGDVIFRVLVDIKNPNDQWRRVTLSFDDYVKYMETDSYMEDFVSYIISEEKFEKMWKARCPELVKKNVYMKKGSRDSTQISKDSPGKDWEEEGSFYCAAKKGTCESNFAIIQVRESDDDFWVLSNPDEVEATKNYGNKTTVCYGWKDADYKTKIMDNFIAARDTVVSKQKKIYHLVYGETWADRTSRYTTDINEVKQLILKGYKLRESMGFVADEATKNSLKAECPELIKRTIYTRDTIPTLNLIDSKLYPEYGNYSSNETFYCAPYAGYCGALKPFYYLKIGDSWTTDNMFTENYDELLYYVKQKKYSVSSDRLICYGWDDDTVYRRETLDKVINRGKVIYRATVEKSRPVDWWRRYTTDFNTYTQWIDSDSEMDDFILNVIRQDDYAEFSETCQNLVQMKIFKKGGDRDPSYIGTTAPTGETGWSEAESFYCAAVPDDCMANFPIMSIKEREGDYFFPSKIDEIFNYEDAGISVETLCYGWKPLNLTSTRNKYKSSKKTVLTSNKKMYRLVNRSGGTEYHIYTMNSTYRQTLLSQGYQEEKYVSLGVDEATRNSLAADCPNLMPMNVYQRQSSPRISLIDSKLFPRFTDYQKSESFYCAPYKGYCGASNPIYFIGSTKDNEDNMYSQDYNEIVNAYNNATGVFKGADFWLICYGWDMPEDEKEAKEDIEYGDF